MAVSFSRSSFFLFALFCFCQLNAQLLDNSTGNAFTDVPFFNTKFVKASKIKEIKGEYVFKKQGDVMRQTDFVYEFQFDTLGNLIRHYKTAKGDILTDSSVAFYTYDERGLKTWSQSQKKGFLRTIYTRDSLGRVIQEEVYRDIDTLHSLLDPEIERSLLWNSETMKYEEYMGQYRKKVYNSYGNQYLEYTSYYDSLGFLSRTEELFTITQNRITKYYTYSDKGFIAGIKTIKNTDSIPLEEVQFVYDQFGNLLTKKIYKNGVYTTEYSIIYSQVTGLLSSVLIREISTNFISIIRFKEPTFWDAKTEQKTERENDDESEDKKEGKGER